LEVDVSKIAGFFLVVLWLCSCGSGDGASPSDTGTGDGAVDAADAAQTGVGDVVPDAGMDGPGDDDVGDLREGDGEAPDVEPDSGGACEKIQGRLVAEGETPEKFQLSLFHFNIQYVAGGLVGFVDREGMNLDEQQVEDRIVVESLEPLLYVLETHPTWGFDIEMQGYMLDVTRERHPKILDRIRDLAALGQVHVDSFHYSDQLWVAHPLPSMQHSWALNQRAFDKACLPFGGALFTQEGQFGEGLARYAKENDRVALLPINLLKYFQGDGPIHLFYELDGAPVVIAGRGVTEQAGDRTVSVEWHFMNDGELACTGNGNPYFGTAFAYDQWFTKAWVEELEQKEAEGWRVVTIAEYVEAVKGYGFEPPSLPAVGDGTWQAGETANVHRWMGLTGGFGDTEDDNGVLTSLTRSRIALQGAETVVLEAEKGSGDVSAAKAILDEGWRAQILGEVSDSTGWNPWKGEVEYSLEHSAKGAKAAVQALAQPGVPEVFAGLMADTATGAVGTRAVPPVYYTVSSSGDFAVKLGGSAPVTAPVEAIVKTEGWSVAQEWTELGPDLAALTVTFTPAGEPAACSRVIKITFPGASEVVEYVPATTEDEAGAPPGKATAKLDVSKLALVDDNSLALPLANGLVGLGSQEWVISVNALNHVAAIIPKGEKIIVFDNRSQPVPDEATDSFAWMFLYLGNADAGAAAALANSVNVWPVVQFVE